MKRKRIDEAAELLRARAGGAIDCAVVLGSGFGGVLRDRLDGTPIKYGKIPGMPEPTVPGHAGEALIGELHGRRVVTFGGRFHLYEGRRVADVVYPIIVALAAGARTVILTNAAGGINVDYRPGDLMLLADHINLTGQNPMAAEGLPGIKDRFVDMVDAYAPHLRDLARHMAGEYSIVMHTGVYAGITGPTYETPAEARWLRSIGADAVGMSTVLETIAARAYGADVVAFSLITNVHDGARTSHDEVLAASQRGAADVARLIEGIVANVEGPAGVTAPGEADVPITIPVPAEPAQPEAELTPG